MVPYPTAQEEIQIVKTCGKADQVAVKKILTKEKIKDLQRILDSVTCDDSIVEYIVSIVSVTRTITAISKKNDISKYISFGASPRSGIAMLQCAKAHAMFNGRSFVTPEDVNAVALSVLRHRLVLSYEAAADGVTADDIISRILSFVPVP